MAVRSLANHLDRFVSGRSFRRIFSMTFRNILFALAVVALLAVVILGAQGF